MARIAIDIDSTLHHYWDLLDRIAQERFGVELPYAEQRTWGITALERHQLHECVLETHTEENILAAEPYPDAVRDGRGLERAGPLDPHHEPPGDDDARGDRDVARPDRPALRRPALLLRQGHALRRARRSTS